MKHIFILILSLSISVVHAQIVNKIDIKLTQLASGQAKNIVIMMKEQSDISAVGNIKGKDAKATFVYHQLYSEAKESQQQIIHILTENKIRHRSFYIVNMISATCNMDMIKRLSEREDVAYIIEDSKFTMQQMPERDETSKGGERAPIWGLNKIGAPTVWSMGHTGQGVVIGGQDTGYAWEVTTIKSKYRGWDGVTADHDYNWHDAVHSNSRYNPCGYDNPQPCDDHNHGTHTMGTMVGSLDNNGDDIGVAPGAKWIGCRNMDNGDGTLTTYVECFEWFLAPYPVSGGSGDPTKMPHVINNSWGCPPVEGCNTTNFDIMEQALNNLRNAGCVVVVSAGNAGPNCATVKDPAAIFEGSFSVGATNSSDVIANFSSRGVVEVDGSFRLKPNVSAPGVNVRSCNKDGIFENYSGTSMAGPHVAGLVALIISANPNLAGEVDQIEDIIEQTAYRLTSSLTCGDISGSNIPNTTYGYGRIDAVAAVSRAKNELYVPFIKVDQFGYLPSSEKVAVIADPDIGYNNTSHYTPTATMVVKNSRTHQIVYSGSPVTWNGGDTHDQSGDKIWWFDFSSVTTPGVYHVAGFPDGGDRSEDFVIGDNIYEEALNAAFKTFYYQRCGTAKSTPHAANGYVDSACHLQDVTCKFIDDPNISKDLSGGWHDAGDYNKYVNFSYKPVLDLLWSYEMNPEAWQSDNLNIPESGNGVPDLLDEIKVELDWLLKMQDNDGGVHCVVGVQNHATASPPSADNANRYYAKKTTSASWSTAAMFAFAAKQFSKIDQPIAQTYAVTLQSKAIAAWNWATANPSITYNNSANNLAAGEQEVSSYESNMRKLVAAIYLYDITGENQYKNYVESNYTASHMYQWSYVYPFENILQTSLLHFSQLKGVTVSVINDIQNRYRNCINSHDDYLTAYNNHTDAYRAYVTTQNITWGSNTTKCNQGMLYQDYQHFNLDVSKNPTITNITADYIHYIHGINPNGLTYLTNMGSKGADRSVNTVYHSWFTDGNTDWDDVRTSKYGPPPGFIPGGPNPGWELDGCCPSGCGSSQNNSLCIMQTPPAGQPVLKSYYDWNAGWPQNSWTVTEPAIYTQAAYLKLLAGHHHPEPEALPTDNQVKIDTDIFYSNTGRSIILTSSGGTHYRIKVNNIGRLETEIVNVLAAESTMIQDAHLYFDGSGNGHIIKAPNNNLWKIDISKSGMLDASPITAPVDDYVESMSGDVVVRNADYGWITKDEDGICYLITISDSGRIISKPVQCN